MRASFLGYSILAVFTCIVLIVMPVQSQSLEETINELRIKEERFVEIEPRNWDELIKNLEDVYKIKIILCMSDQAVPTPLKGDLSYILSKVQTTTMGRISAKNKVLLLGSPIGPTLKKIEDYSVASEIVDVEEKLAESFAKNQNQLKLFQEGRGVSASALSPNQMELVKGLFSQNSHGEEFQSFVKTGEITAFISMPIPAMFIHGINVYGPNLKDGSFQKQADVVLRYRQGRSIEELLKITSPLFEKDSLITIDNIKGMSVKEAFNRFKKEIKSEIVISPAISNKVIFASPGKYTASEFAAFVLFVSGAELRHIGEKWYCGLQTLPASIDEDKQLVGEAEAFWRTIVPLYNSLLKSPNSKFIPFTSAVMNKPRLNPLQSFTGEQREYILKYNQINSSDLANLSRDTEIYIAPLIEVRANYINSEGKKAFIGRGFTPRFYHSWLWLHTNKAIP